MTEKSYTEDELIRYGLLQEQAHVTIPAVPVMGKLKEYIIGRSLSGGVTEVPQLSLTIQDTRDVELSRSQLVKRGQVVYLGSSARFFAISNYDFDSGKTGPIVKLDAIAWAVHRLQSETGAKSWGTQDVGAWATAVCRAAGIAVYAQPGLGRMLLVREAGKPGDRPSTWDVMADAAEAVGAWLFMHGNRLVIARPSWLVSRPWGGRSWRFYWNGWGSAENGLQRMPRLTVGDDGRARLSLSMVGRERFALLPGERVDVLGKAAERLGMGGGWLISSMDYGDMSPDGSTDVECVRAVDPERSGDASGGAAAPSGSAGSVATSGGGSTRTGDAWASRYMTVTTRLGRKMQWPVGIVAGSHGEKGSGVNRDVWDEVITWCKRNEGRRIDADGAYGAQCTDLPKQFYIDQGYAHYWRGHGKDTAYNATKLANFRWVKPSDPAWTGDIVSWGSSWGGGYGHTGIVIADLGDRLRVFHQNPKAAGFATLSKRGLVGYARCLEYDPRA